MKYEYIYSLNEYACVSQSAFLQNCDLLNSVIYQMH